MKPEILPGRVVFSKKGRDKGRYFVVLYSVDADFVMMADGDTRKMDHLKKKRRKHLKTTGIVVDELRTRLSNGEAVENHEVRSWLKREEK